MTYDIADPRLAPAMYYFRSAYENEFFTESMILSIVEEDHNRYSIAEMINKCFRDEFQQYCRKEKIIEEGDVICFQ